MWLLRLNLGPLERQSVLLTSEPPLLFTSCFLGRSGQPLSLHKTPSEHSSVTFLKVLFVHLLISLISFTVSWIPPYILYGTDLLRWNRYLLCLHHNKCSLKREKTQTKKNNRVNRHVVASTNCFPNIVSSINR